MVAASEPQRVSAAEFIRGFANWRLHAAREPVVVTHHGKDAHVLISLDDYRRLDAEREGGPAAQSNLLHASLAGLIESIRDAVIMIDRQWRVAATNPAASDMLEMPASSMIGSPLVTILPGLENNLLFQRVIRLIDHRERFSGEVPGLLRPRQWLRADLIPAPIGGAIILRDVSDAMDNLAVADARQAMLNAVDVHGGIGHARISVRGVVEDASDVLTALVGVDATAIRRVGFSALLPLGQRQPFVEALETVFRTGEAERLTSEIVTREGTALPVTLSIAERRGPYASEGAVVVITLRATD